MPLSPAVHQAVGVWGKMSCFRNALGRTELGWGGGGALGGSSHPPSCWFSCAKMWVWRQGHAAARLPKGGGCTLVPLVPGRASGPQTHLLVPKEGGTAA